MLAFHIGLERCVNVIRSARSRPRRLDRNPGTKRCRKLRGVRIAREQSLDGRPIALVQSSLLLKPRIGQQQIANEVGSEPGTLPFCQLIRTSPQYRIMSQDPRFLDTYIAEESLLERHAFYRSLVDAGYAPAVAKTLSLFQVNGCFNAAKTLTDNDALWVEARQAIDTFICGGLEACIAAKVSPRR